MRCYLAANLSLRLSASLCIYQRTSQYLPCKNVGKELSTTDNMTGLFERWIQNCGTKGLRPSGVLWISSDGDDQKGAKKQSPKKSLGLPTKPKKSLDQALLTGFMKERQYNAKNIKTGQERWAILQILDCFQYPKKSPLKSNHPKSTCQISNPPNSKSWNWKFLTPPPPP